MSLLISRAGKKYGLVTVLYRDISKSSKKYKNAFWICKCVCGNLCSIRADYFNHLTSCGCYGKEFLSKRKQPLKVMFKSEKHRLLYYKVTKPLYDRIRLRDNNCCALCGETHKPLHVHHILRKSEYKDWIIIPENLILMCETCHLYTAHSGNTHRVDYSVASELIKIVFEHSKNYTISEIFLNKIKKNFEEIFIHG